MPFKITYTKRFEKNYQKLTVSEKTKLREKLNYLTNNPMHPSLRTKRIRGTSDLFEFSVNMDIRVIWQYEGDTLILLLDVGHHDVLNQF